MATIRLEFELDSEVYPELHATLSAMRSTRARAERMRQLAAAGLVWEKVRLHGAAAIAQPAEEPPPGLVTRADVNPAPPATTEPLPPIERRTATSGRRARASAAETRRATDFVDLAINAEPTPVPLTPPERRGRPSRKDVEQVIRELPVLLDVVEDVAPLPERHAQEEPADDVAETASWASMNAYPDDLAGTPPEPDASDTDHDASELPEAALHVTALSQKPATRSRLMRMKERGLFKNG